MSMVLDTFYMLITYVSYKKHGRQYCNKRSTVPDNECTIDLLSHVNLQSKTDSEFPLLTISASEINVTATYTTLFVTVKGVLMLL